jgi:hypothetical protein
MIRTGVNTQSAAFEAGPAKAMAVAIFEDSAGNRKVQDWTDDVRLNSH